VTALDGQCHTLRPMSDQPGMDREAPDMRAAHAAHSSQRYGRRILMRGAAATGVGLAAGLVIGSEVLGAQSPAQPAKPDITQGVQVLTPMDHPFGAVGNGVADDRAAVQACIDSSHPGQVVDLSTAPVSYGISAPLSLLPGRTYRGACLNYNAAAIGAPLEITCLSTFSGVAALADAGALATGTASVATQPLTVLGVGVDLANVPSGQSPDGILLMTFGALVQFCFVRGSANSRDGVHFTDTNQGGFTVTNSGVENRVVACNIKAMARHGIRVDKTNGSVLTDGFCTDNIVAMSAATLGDRYSSAGNAIDIENGADWQVSRNHVYRNPNHGIVVNFAFSSFVAMNKVDNFGLAGGAGTYYGIQISNASRGRTIVTDNQVDGDESYGSASTNFVYLAAAALDTGGYVDFIANSVRTVHKNPSGGVGTALSLSGNLTCTDWATTVTADSGITPASNALAAAGDVHCIRGPLPGTVVTNPSDPSAGARTSSVVMAGLANSAQSTPIPLFTPRLTGNVEITITGDASTGASPANISVQCRCGTADSASAAPANGAAVTGKQVGASTTVPCGVTATLGKTPFILMGKATGLTVGASYFIDLGFNTSNASDEACLSNITCKVAEVI
jgi:hypothetical protein